MKRLLTLLLAMCLLPAVACGSQTPPAPTPTTTQGESAEVHLLAAPTYPEMAPYPDESAFYDSTGSRFDSNSFYKAHERWSADILAQKRYPAGDLSTLDPFFARSMQVFLSRSNGENRVCSPVNLYMALAMLAETTAGESRQQILDALGIESMEDLRLQAKGIWNTTYRDDGATTSILANSLWLNQNISFLSETMDALAEHYYTSSYQGEMGSPSFDRALQDWLNEQTGGLLEDQLGNLKMDPQTILTLASTIYFRAKWANEFSENRTEEGLFSLLSPDGATVPCDFMHQSASRTYYWGDRFSAVSLPFENGGDMWLILPDPEVPMDELLVDEQMAELLLSGGNWEQSKHLIVNLALPKFDVSSQLDLIPGLKDMGIKNVFDFDTSDFSPLTTDTDELAVTQAQHGARVLIDEQGCEAAAYTVMLVCGSAMPPTEEVDFILDRPFLFAITGENGLPLFTGVVNRPQ